MQKRVESVEVASLTLVWMAVFSLHLCRIKGREAFLTQLDST